MWLLRLLLLVPALVGLNLVNNLVLHQRAYVPVNLLFAAGIVVLARATGMSWDDLGLSRERLRRGLRVELAAVAVITVAVAAIALVPTLQGHFHAAGSPDGDAVAWSVLVRIPFGTALPEELLFRSVLLGVLLTRLRPSRAAIWSAALFGLWHVLPTLDGASAVNGDLGVVVVAVVSTTLAGAALAWLRVRADSILAPVAAHVAVNVVATVATYLVVGAR